VRDLIDFFCRAVRLRNTPRICVFADAMRVDSFACQLWRENALKAVRRAGRYSVGLSGGQSPISFYQLLSREENLPWDKTHIFLADERYVPLDHPDSNGGAIKKNFLNLINIPSSNIHLIETDMLSLELAAQQYEQTLRKYFSLPFGQWPRFDLFVLGVGEDGHTASLFPDSVIDAADRLVLSVSSAKVKHSRLSLSLSVINSARCVVFLIKGKNKANIFKEIRRRDCPLPAALVSPNKGKLYFLLDQDVGGVAGFK